MEMKNEREDWMFIAKTLTFLAGLGGLVLLFIAGLLALGVVE